jgi:hypothetical protein
MSADGTGANAAAADAVATLLQLFDAAMHAYKRGRKARSLELCERALAAAAASRLPLDSLIFACFLDHAVTCRSTMVADATAPHGTPRHALLVADAWRSDEELVSLARRALMLCDARFRAGTLFTPTREEHAFFDADDLSIPAALFGVGSYLYRAAQVLCKWPPPNTRDEDDARLRAVHGALQAALEAERRGFMNLRNVPLVCAVLQQQQGRAHHGRQMCDVAAGVGQLCHFARILLTNALGVSSGSVWQRLRATCAIAAAEEAALRQLAERNLVQMQVAAGHFADTDQRLRNGGVERQQRAAADVTRHGLRACALPECDATEPEPKAFKVCARCRAVVYCCQAHQQQDWRRHKREDDCKAKAAAAAGQ